MHKIGICNNEKAYREEIKEYIIRYLAKKATEEYEILEYSSGEEISGTLGLDVVFMNICMEDMDGLSVRDRLQQEDADTLIIFVSAHIERMSDAFGKNVIGFIKKPIDYDEFCKKVNSALEICRKKKIYTLYDESGVLKKISISEIKYIRSVGRYSELHVNNEKRLFLSSKSLQGYKAELGVNFEMSERSYLVNMKFVIEVGEDVVLADGEHIPLSRRRAQIVRDKFRKSIK